MITTEMRLKAFQVFNSVNSSLTAEEFMRIMEMPEIMARDLLINLVITKVIKRVERKPLRYERI